jgi:hypothetical protein
MDGRKQEWGENGQREKGQREMENGRMSELCPEMVMGG